MTQDPLNLIWIDLEMTGLDTNRDYIIEIATVITDGALNILAEGPVLAIHQSDETLNAMDNWNQNQHGKSGLIDRVRASRVSVADAERQTLNSSGSMCRRAARRCAATASARTGVFSPAACRPWRPIFTIAIST